MFLLEPLNPVYPVTGEVCHVRRNEYCYGDCEAPRTDIGRLEDGIRRLGGRGRPIISCKQVDLLFQY